MESVSAVFHYDLRWLIQLAALSAVLTLIALKAFAGNPISRRAFIVISALCLLVVPNVIPSSGITWPLTLASPPDFSFARDLPDFVIYTWWLIGGALISRRLAHLYQQVQQQALAVEVKNQQLSHKVGQMIAVLPQIEKVTLKFGTEPCASTIMSNRIFVPSSWEQWSDNTLTAVIAHELVHVERRDDRWLLLADIIADWYWWLPWLRSLRNQLCRSMEESADDRAAEWFTKTHGYLEGVHAAAIHIGQQAAPIKAQGTMFFKGHSLVQRVGRFLEFRNQELDTRGLYWGMLVALISVPIITGVTFVPFEETYQGGFVSVAATSFDPASNAHQTTIPKITSTRQHKAPLIVIDEPSAIYPGSALMAGITGEVVVSYVVTASGTTARAKVIFAAPENQFEKAALKAVELSRYASGRAQTLDSSIAPGASVRVKRTFRFAIRTEPQ